MIVKKIKEYSCLCAFMMLAATVGCEGDTESPAVETQQEAEVLRAEIKAIQEQARAARRKQQENKQLKLTEFRSMTLEMLI